MFLLSILLYVTFYLQILYISNLTDLYVLKDIYPFIRYSDMHLGHIQLTTVLFFQICP